MPRTRLAADAVFRVLSAEVGSPGAGELELRLAVRVTNREPAGYMTASPSNFRLRVGGVPRAPANEFYETVAPASAAQVAVTFVVPDTTRAAELAFRHDQRGGERATPIALGAAAPGP